MAIISLAPISFLNSMSFEKYLDPINFGTPTLLFLCYRKVCIKIYIPQLQVYIVFYLKYKMNNEY